MKTGLVERFSFLSRTLRLAGFLVVSALIMCMWMPGSVYCEDGIVVEDSVGNEMFVVADNGNTFSKGWVFTGNGTRDARIELGHLSKEDKHSYIDLNSAPLSYPDFAARFIRASGANGMTILDHRGTGKFMIRCKDNAPMTFKTNDIERARIDPEGRFGIGTPNPVYALDVEGEVYASEGFTDGSSREIKENIRGLSMDEALHTLDGLDPVKYNYKTNTREGRVGFVAEDVPELVAFKDRKRLSPMDIVAVLTKVVKEQQKTISALSQKVAKLEAE